MGIYYSIVTGYGFVPTTDQLQVWWSYETNNEWDGEYEAAEKFASKFDLEFASCGGYDEEKSMLFGFDIHSDETRYADGGFIKKPKIKWTADQNIKMSTALEAIGLKWSDVNYYAGLNVS